MIRSRTNKDRQTPYKRGTLPSDVLKTVSQSFIYLGLAGNNNIPRGTCGSYYMKMNNDN